MAGGILSAAGATALAVLALARCSTSSNAPAGGSGGSTTIDVVAAENFWGSLAAPIGAHATSVPSSAR